MGAGHVEIQPEKATALKMAVDDAVVHQATGSLHASSSGLSFYYPTQIGNKHITKFAQCPTALEYKKFASYIEKRYVQLNQSGESLVKAVSKPEVGDDGVVSLSLAPEDIDKVIDVGYEVYAAQPGTDNLRYLGYDSELGYDEQSGLLYGLFDGRWPTLDGQPLMISLVDEDDESILYKAPIMLNGEHSNLLIEWNWKIEGESTGYYEIIGTWKGIDESGSSSRDFQRLEAGDKITPLYTSVHKDEITLKHSMKELTDYEKHEDKGREISFEENMNVEQEKLAEGDYLYQFIALDYLLSKSSFPAIEGHMSADGKLEWS
ncbi:MAG: hypothetical protein ACOYD7_03745 [Raoultibacter sp.]|jgi:hypothetical protein